MKMTSGLKRKVFALGNKLAPRMGGDRKAAFCKAWKLVKAGTLEIKVSGVTFGNRQTALERLAKYDPAQIKAVLVPEPNNPADPAAITVMVMVQNGAGMYRLGYETFSGSACGRSNPPWGVKLKTPNSVLIFQPKTADNLKE